MLRSFSFFFFNDTATTEIYTLSLHDALPISFSLRSPLLVYTAPRPIEFRVSPVHRGVAIRVLRRMTLDIADPDVHRVLFESEVVVFLEVEIPPEQIGEHTSELQSRLHLVCRL